MKPILHPGGNEPFGYLKADLLLCDTLKQTFANFLNVVRDKSCVPIFALLLIPVVVAPLVFLFYF